MHTVSRSLHFVTSNDSSQVILSTEPVHRTPPKHKPAPPSGVLLKRHAEPLIPIRIGETHRHALVRGVRPQNVTERPIRRRLCEPVDGVERGDRLDRGAEAAVEAEELVVDHRRNGQLVEYLHEPHVHFHVVFGRALLLEIEV